jgi:glutaredoxin 3
MEKSGRHTVPQIWIGERHIGGCDDLMLLDRSGKLEQMLGAVEAC